METFYKLFYFPRFYILLAFIEFTIEPRICYITLMKGKYVKTQRVYTVFTQNFLSAKMMSDFFRLLEG